MLCVTVYPWWGGNQRRSLVSNGLYVLVLP